MNGACADWTKAGQLGSANALSYIQKYCESKSVSANSKEAQDVTVLAP